MDSEAAMYHNAEFDLNGNNNEVKRISKEIEKKEERNATVEVL
jgi:hypothetical protein